jgi:hypothetical protein
MKKSTKNAKNTKIENLKPNQQKTVKGGLNFTKITF